MDPSADRQAVTQLLRQWSGGDKQALDQLVPFVYDQLRKLASNCGRTGQSYAADFGIFYEFISYLTASSGPVGHYIQYSLWETRLVKNLCNQDASCN